MEAEKDLPYCLTWQGLLSAASYRYCQDQLLRYSICTQTIVTMVRVGRHSSEVIPWPSFWPGLPAGIRSETMYNIVCLTQQPITFVSRHFTHYIHLDLIGHYWKDQQAGGWSWRFQNRRIHQKDFLKGILKHEIFGSVVVYRNQTCMG
jgi:hypothetical protein